MAHAPDRAQAGRLAARYLPAVGQAARDVRRALRRRQVRRRAVGAACSAMKPWLQA